MKRLSVLAAIVLSSVMLAGCVDDSKDADEDGVPDVIEERGRIIFVYGMTEVVERVVKSDPTKVDTDGDGLSDYDEMLGRSLYALNALDPSDPDTDGDGLSDCQEWPVQANGQCPLMNGRFQDYDLYAYTTDPSRADGDLGGPSRYNFNTINNGQGYLDRTDNDLVPSYTAVKGDGISDYDEIFGYTIEVDGRKHHGITSDPNDVDSDNDGLEDGEETLLFGSNPVLQDTDKDGCLDGQDPVPDADETYGLQLGQFTLKDGPRADNGANVVFMVQVMDTVQAFPESSGISVNAGQTLDVSEHSGSGIEPAGCYLASPVNPWTKVQILTFHRPGGTSGSNVEAWMNGDLVALDSHKDSIPDEQSSQPGVMWNIVHDVFRWDRPEDAFAWQPNQDNSVFGTDGALLKFSGSDGEMEFRPSVSR